MHWIAFVIIGIFILSIVLICILTIPNNQNSIVAPVSSGNPIIVRFPTRPNSVSITYNGKTFTLNPSINVFSQIQAFYNGDNVVIYYLGEGKVNVLVKWK